MEFVYVHGADTSLHTRDLLSQYYALRSRAYDHYWGERYYPDGPDEYDAKENISYVFAMEDGKMLAGGRQIFHPPGSDVEVPMEVKHPKMKMKFLLPHIDTKNLSYCEIGGLVADPDAQESHKHLGTKLIIKRLEMLRSGEIKNGDVPVDVVIGSAGSQGIGPFLRAAREAGISGIIRKDLIQKDEHWDTLLHPLVIGLNPDIVLVPPGQQKKAAVPLEKFEPPARHRE